MKRRDFLARLVSTAIGTTALAGQQSAARAAETSPPRPAAPQVGAIDPPAGVTRTWLGPELWANRLQDFRVANGRYEAVAAGAGRMRSVAVLTRSVRLGTGTLSLSMLTGTLAGGAGFSGFLLGAGAGALDYRAAALVQAASGTGGGLLCTYENDGRCRFRAHTAETNQLSYPVRSTGSAGPARTTAEQVMLTVTAAPSVPAGTFLLTLTATRVSNGQVLSTATLDGVADAAIAGGVLAVSGPVGSTAARFWFRSITTGGTKLVTTAQRAMGPILGTLYSLNGGVLKMSVQLFPIGSGEPHDVTLQYRRTGTTTWTTGPTAQVGNGFTAQLRVSGWDTTRAFDYQVVYASATTSQSTYLGTVPAAPATLSTVVVGVVNCTIHSFRPLDRGSPFTPKLAGETAQGLYTSRNLYFPYAELTGNLAKQRPHLLAVLGDQFYEDRPTAQDSSAAPTMDFLSRYFLWMWAFRDLTKAMPCVVLVDDHDVYQGNLWGHEGAHAPNGYTSGGYANAASWVNTVQRVQQGHDPDPYDPTPVKQGITVSYTAFTYGGVSFALVEDRKFKYGPDPVGPTGQPTPIAALPMLGSRQETFLGAWKAMHPGQPKLVLSQTTYAVVKTAPDGSAETDPDNDAYQQARDRALALVKSAGAVMVCGDQHLGTIVRHGLSSFTDGPVQFTVPAAGTAWQRWFEATNLPHPGSTPHTGDFTDGYGNKMHVLAVSNAAITQAQYVAAYGTATHNFGDRSLKSEGYGIVRIDKTAQQFVLESWRWDTDPTAVGARQFAGWPVTVPFASV